MARHTVIFANKGRAVTHTIAIVILAAGQSRRMRGMDKLLEPVQGQPLLGLICQRAQATGLDVYVCLPDPGHARAAMINGATPVWVPDADQGMSASIRRAIGALPDRITDAMILPADMPEITTDDLNLVAKVAEQLPPDTICRATSADGVPGHPVLFPRRYFAALHDLTGDKGARELLRRNRDQVHLTALPGTHATCDLDTPEAWKEWRLTQ